MYIMLSSNEQLVLLELLRNKKLTKNEFLNKKIKNKRLFCNESRFFKIMAKLKDFGLVNNNFEKIGFVIDENTKKIKQKTWQLTFKGCVRAKLLALDKNNPKDYKVNLRDEIIEFSYEP